MIHLLFISCILHQAIAWGTCITNIAGETEKRKSPVKDIHQEITWKALFDFQNSLKTKKDTVHHNIIYLNQNKKSEQLSKSMMKENLKNIFKKYRGLDIMQEHGGNFGLKLLKDEMENMPDSSLLNEADLFNKPNEEESKESENEKKMGKKILGAKPLLEMKKNLLNDKSQLIWMRVN